MPCRNDTDHRFRWVVFMEGMGHHDQQHATHQAKGLPALFPVLDPILNGHLQGIAEDQSRLLEAQPVLPLVGLILGLVPVKPN